MARASDLCVWDYLLDCLKIMQVLFSGQILQNCLQLTQKRAANASRPARIVQQGAEFVFMLCDAAHRVQQRVQTMR